MFKLISHYFRLNNIKEILVLEDNKGLTEMEINELNSIKAQNPFGMITFVLGAASFVFGPLYIVIPIITFILFILTYGTFEKEKEDNPWTFYIGLLLAVIGFYMNVVGIKHSVIF